MEQPTKPCIKCLKTLTKRKTESWSMWFAHKYCLPCVRKVTLFKKGHIPWDKGKKRPEIQTWLKDVQFQKGQSSWNKGRQHLRDERHPKWKGNNVGYGALHDWVILRLGKANYCSKDKNHISPVYHWANKSGEYKRDLNDWWSLCPSCNKTDGVSREKVWNKNRQRIINN